VAAQAQFLIEHFKLDAAVSDLEQEIPFSSQKIKHVLIMMKTWKLS